MVPKKKPDTIFINISPTIILGGDAGIQRVVRQLFSQLHLQTLHGFRFIFGANTKHGWYTADSKDLNTTNNDSVVLSKKNVFNYLPFFIKAWLRSLYLNFFMPSRFSKQNLIQLPKNAIIVELDAPWIDNWRNYRSFKNTLHVLYDVTPLSHPSYCKPEAIYVFKRWLEKNIPISLGIISISKSSLNSIVNTLSQHNINYPKVLDYFYLGSDFTYEKVNNNVAPLPFFLFVGSIAPHKNIKKLLEAHRQYRLSGGEWGLTLIGRSAGYADLDDCLETALRHGVTWLKDADDQILHQHYRTCGAVITPSIWEGFGLPLAEALHYKKKIIASNIAVFKELAGNSVHFFDVDSVDDLTKAMWLAEQDKLIVPSTQPLGLLNWQQSAQQFAEVVVQMIEKLELDKQ